MRYIDVRWRHDLPDEPVRLLSEIDEDGYEVRKIEVNEDGHADFASAENNAGRTVLGDQPIPSDAEIAADTQFSVSRTSAEAFEAAWDRVVTKNRLG